MRTSESVMVSGRRPMSAVSAEPTFGGLVWEVAGVFGEIDRKEGQAGLIRVASRVLTDATVTDPFWWRIT